MSRPRRPPALRTLVLSLLVVLPATACGDPTPGDGPGGGGGFGGGGATGDFAGDAPDDAPHDASADGAAGLVVPLPDGGRLVLPGAPARIVAANNSTLDLLMALVEPGRIVGIPADASQFASGEVAAASRFERYRGEDLLALEPDLVVAHVWQDVDTTNVLRRAGVPVLTLPGLRGYDDLEAVVGLVAAACDVAPAGDALLADLRRRRDALIAAADAAAGRRDVGILSYVNFGSGGWTAGADTSLDVVIRLAGLRNLAAEAGRVGNDRIDIEELLQIDPDVIVVGGTEEEPGTSARYLRDEPALRHLSALRHDRVVFLPPRLQSTVSHHLLDAAELLAARVDALDL